MHENPQKIKTLFIVSIQRSGSNWLQRSLDYHPRILVRGEVHPPRILSLIEKMRTGDEESEAVMQSQGIYQQIAVHGVYAMIRANLEANGYDLAGFEGYAADKTAFVCHKSLRAHPEQIQYIQLLQKYFPKAKKILLVRDVREIIVSVASWKGKAEKLKLLSPRPLSYLKFFRYLQNWVAFHEKWIPEMKKDPESLVISFKEMKKDFRKVMAKIHCFLEIPVDEGYIEELFSNFYSIKSNVYKEENQKRGYNFFRSGKMGEWRNRFKWYHMLALWLYNRKIQKILDQV